MGCIKSFRLLESCQCFLCPKTYSGGWSTAKPLVSRLTTIGPIFSAFVVHNVQFSTDDQQTNHLPSSNQFIIHLFYINKPLRTHYMCLYTLYMHFPCLLLLLSECAPANTHVMPPLCLWKPLAVRRHSEPRVFSTNLRGNNQAHHTSIKSIARFKFTANFYSTFGGLFGSHDYCVLWLILVNMYPIFVLVTFVHCEGIVTDQGRLYSLRGW